MRLADKRMSLRREPGFPCGGWLKTRRPKARLPFTLAHLLASVLPFVKPWKRLTGCVDSACHGCQVFQSRSFERDCR